MPKFKPHVKLVKGQKFDASWLAEIDWSGLSRGLGASPKGNAMGQITIATALYVRSAQENKLVARVQVLKGQLERLILSAEGVRALLSKESTPPFPRRQTSVKTKVTRDSARREMSGNVEQRNGFLTLEAIERKYFKKRSYKTPHYQHAVFPLLLHAVEASIAVARWVGSEMDNDLTCSP